MQLHYKVHGSGPAIVLLHGLFGSHDNWAFVTRALSGQFTVLVPDQRNHGASPHSPQMDYPAMAEDIRELLEIESFAEAHLLGHSMGGKAAMEFALSYPERASSLAVEDIAPKTYPAHHRAIIEGMLSLPVESLSSLAQAEHHLAGFVLEITVRQFLLKNLRRDSLGRFRWRLGLRELLQNLETIAGGLKPGRQYDGPALFVAGGRSDYITAADMPAVRELFPAAHLEVIPEAAHWVHSDAGSCFMHLLNAFYSQKQKPSHRIK